MTGEVLLVVDGQVQDSAVYKNDAEKISLVAQFTDLGFLIKSEHPYADVRIDTREKI